jgi:hypothetical protein
VVSRLLLATATAGFVLSAVVHLASFAPIAPALGEAPTVVLLGGAFALLVAMFWRLGRAGAPTRVVLRGRLRVYDWHPLVALVPEPIRWLGLATVFYAMMNFALSIVQGGGVTASAVDGKLYLTAPGAERREVSREEYDAHARLTTRLHSGHLLLFYLVPLIYFRFVDPPLVERRPALAPGGPA